MESSLNKQCLKYLLLVLKADAECLQDIVDNAPTDLWDLVDKEDAIRELSLNRKIVRSIKNI